LFDIIPSFSFLGYQGLLKITLLLEEVCTEGMSPFQFEHHAAVSKGALCVFQEPRDNAQSASDIHSSPLIRAVPSAGLMSWQIRMGEYRSPISA